MLSPIALGTLEQALQFCIIYNRVTAQLRHSVPHVVRDALDGVCKRNTWLEFQSTLRLVACLPVRTAIVPRTELHHNGKSTYIEAMAQQQWQETTSWLAAQDGVSTAPRDGPNSKLEFRSHTESELYVL